MPSWLSRRARKQGAAARTRRTTDRKLWIEGLEDRRVLSGVVTIGDSWAYLVAAGAPTVYAPTPAPGGYSNPLGTTMATFQPGVPVYNESFGGGTAAQMVGELYTPTGVIARINAHPDADVVWLSAGGNDLLLGQLGGGFWVGNANNANVYADVQTNVQTIVDAILNVRPDIQVVVMGYDYINIWDMISGQDGDILRLNLGVIKSGNLLVDANQNLAVNDGMKAAEAGKTAIANASRRVAHVENFGLINTYVGYSGYFGNFPAGTTYPPELYPYLPTPPSRMASGDAIHLNNAGYSLLTYHAEQDFLLSAFSSAGLGLSTNTLAFGDRRIGTSSSLGVTASNTGANFTKVKNLNFQAASGAFSGGGQNFNPLFRDPTLGSDTAAVNYAFAPTGHALSNQSIAVTSDVGSPSISLSGRGVGPTYDGPATLGFSSVAPGAMPTTNFNIGNVTADGDLGNLTNLTLESASFTGPDAARFSLVGFTPNTVLGAGGNAALQLKFDATGAGAGNYSATLTFTTDENAAFGGNGQQFSITLSAEVEASNATVTGRRLFYNNSIWDDPGFGFNNATAIATDKTAYIPTGANTSSFANMSSYTKGINGIMVEVTNAGGTLTADDFTIRVSGQELAANNSPASWAAAPSFSVTLVPDTPTSGTDRYELVWADGAITNRYVYVLVEGNDAAGGFNTNTGLDESDYFFFGNLIGDAGSPEFFPNVDVTDQIQARSNAGQPAFQANAYDFNRDAAVDVSDEIIARNNQTAMPWLALGAGPFLPEAAPSSPPDGDDAGSAAVASALAAPSASPDTAPAVASRTDESVTARTPQHVSISRFWQHLDAASDRRASVLLGSLDDAAETLAIDDWLESDLQLKL